MNGKVMLCERNKNYSYYYFSAAGWLGSNPYLGSRPLGRRQGHGWIDLTGVGGPGGMGVREEPRGGLQATHFVLYKNPYKFLSSSDAVDVLSGKRSLIVLVFLAF